jgi:hypothetical protein
MGILGKSDAVISRRRELKMELVETLAEVAIRCKNGGRTLRGAETDDITDTVSALYLRARDMEPALKSVMISAKGCKGAPGDAQSKGFKNIYEFLGSVKTGGCGEAFTIDCGLYAKFIIDSNPNNMNLKNLWVDKDYAAKLKQATTDGENELAEYLKQPAQRAPIDLQEAIGYLSYYAADMDEAAWKEYIVVAVKDSFNEMAKKDSYRRSILHLWIGNLDKFTYLKALTACIKDYPNKAAAAQRMKSQL